LEERKVLRANKIVNEVEVEHINQLLVIRRQTPDDLLVVLLVFHQKGGLVYEQGCVVELGLVDAGNHGSPN
jgi:hypothetical protein